MRAPTNPIGQRHEARMRNLRPSPGLADSSKPAGLLPCELAARPRAAPLAWLLRACGVTLYRCRLFTRKLPKWLGFPRRQSGQQGENYVTLIPPSPALRSRIPAKPAGPQSCTAAARLRAGPLAWFFRASGGTL